MFSTLTKQHPLKNTFWLIALFCLAYLLFQMIYIPHEMLEVDEFWFAHHIYEYTHKLPYKDFPPYKTVLGYYILSIPLFFSHTLLQPLYYIKDEIAIINTFFLAGVSLWLTRFYNTKAVICTLLFILANQLFLGYSVDLRVDMLATWFALISILMMLSNRFFLSGFVIAISFLISQKAMWFFIATNIALGFYWLAISQSRQIIRQIFIFNLATFLTIFLYLIVWSTQSSFNTILHSVFYEAYTQAKITWYTQIYKICWIVILSDGPLLVFLWPLTWVRFFLHSEKNAEYRRRFFITVYAATVMFFIISYQQAFPYGTVLTIPVYFLIYPDFFSWLINIFQQKPTFTLINKRLFFWFISLCTIIMMGLMIYLTLPFMYYFIALIPISLGIFFMMPQLSSTIKNFLAILILFALLFAGILYPLIRFSLIAAIINNDYQTAMVKVSDALLKEGGGFFAGTPLFYDRDQAIRGLKNLIDPAIKYLSNPSPKILPMLLPSLYLEPRTANQVIQDLKKTPVKFYVNNNRINSLPSTIHDYLKSEFSHYWGSIYLYAPIILSKDSTFRLKFSGNYQVISKPNETLYLDHKKIMSKQIILLTEGMHVSKAKNNYRLKYMPNNKINLDKRFISDNWLSIAKLFA